MLAQSELTLLGPQSRFGDKLLENLSGLPPKRDCDSTGAKSGQRLASVCCQTKKVVVRRVT